MATSRLWRPTGLGLAITVCGACGGGGDSGSGGREAFIQSGRHLQGHQ